MPYRRWKSGMFGRVAGARSGFGYNRRYGTGKYRRAPRTVGRGWSNQRGELKYLDIPIPSTAAFGANGQGMIYSNTPSATADVLCLNAPLQGDDATSHQGRKIRGKSLMVRGTIYAGPSQADQFSIRTLIVWDKCPNGAGPPLLSDILDVSIQGMAYTTAGINLKNRERFKVLCDKMTDMHPDTFGVTRVGDPKTSRPFKFYKKIKGWSTIFNSANTTATSISTGTAIQTGAIWLYTSGDAPVTANLQPYLFSGMSRYRFQDCS